MKLRILNLKRFVLSMGSIALFLFSILFLFTNYSYSHDEQEYKTIYVHKGETLWEIASKEQKINPYYEGKNIRDIIYEIKNCNNLESSDLFEGQTLQILN